MNRIIIWPVTNGGLSNNWSVYDECEAIAPRGDMSLALMRYGDAAWLLPCRHAYGDMLFMMRSVLHHDYFIALA